MQLGSVIGDVTWCSLALLGLAPLAQIPGVRAVLSVAGVGLLLYLGALGIRDAFRAPIVQSTEASGPRRGAFWSGWAISMANPMAVGYWLSVGGALVAAGVIGATRAQTVSFIAGFVGGTFVWAFVMAFAVRWSKQIVTPAIFRAVTFTCGAILIFFGLTLASQALRPLL